MLMMVDEFPNLKAKIKRFIWFQGHLSFKCFKFFISLIPTPGMSLQILNYNHSPRLLVHEALMNTIHRWFIDQPWEGPRNRR